MNGENRAAHKLFSLLISGVIVISTIIPTQLNAQSVQRLFSSPALRAELDRLRLQIASGIAVDQPVTAQPFIELPVFTEEEVEVVYALGGSMRKADGSYTVWINDVAYDQSSLPSNMELLSPFSQGQLRIRDNNSDASFNIKPGQVLNLTTGQLYESYQYQAVLDAAAAESARLAIEEAVNSNQGSGSTILDSAAVEAVSGAAQDL